MQKTGDVMSKSVYIVNVDRELTFTVDMTESDGVHLQLSDGAYGAVLGPGDRLELVLRPAKSDEIKSDPDKKKETEPEEKKETWNDNNDDNGFIKIGEAWGGAAALRKTAAGEEDVFDAPKVSPVGKDENERGKR